MATLRHSPSRPGTSFLEQMLAGGILRWSGVVSSMSKTAGLSGMAQWGLGDERVLMDVQGGGAVWRRGGVDGIMLLALKMEQRFDGGSGF